MAEAAGAAPAQGWPPGMPPPAAAPPPPPPPLTPTTWSEAVAAAAAVDPVREAEPPRRNGDGWEWAPAAPQAGREGSGDLPAGVGGGSERSGGGREPSAGPSEGNIALDRLSSVTSLSNWMGGAAPGGDARGPVAQETSPGPDSDVGSHQPPVGR